MGVQLFADVCNVALAEGTTWNDSSGQTGTRVTLVPLGGPRWSP